MPPTPRLRSPSDAARVRDVLAAATYDQAGILRALGVGDLSDPRTKDLPLLLRRTGGGSPVETLIRLFFLGVDVDAASVRAAVLPTETALWIDAGLLEASGDAVRATLRLLPFQSLMFAFDRPERAFDAHAADYVMGLGSSSLTLAQATVRNPARRALDLGTGCGVQAFLAAPHSERVLALDRNPRAVALTELGAQLSGLGNVEARTGDLFAPVAGERFGLVVSNPPFVISPSSDFIYRDSGLAGDEITQRIVREVPAHLEDGGFCQVLCNWAHVRESSVEDRLAGWFAGTGCDALVMCSETRDAETYASHWIQHTEGADRARHAELFPQWMDYYARHGIEAVSAGLVTLRRRGNVLAAGAHWFRLEPAPPSMRGPAGEAIARAFAAHDFLRAHADDAQLLAARLRVSPNARVRQTLEPAPGGWRPCSAELELAAGLAWRADADAVVANLLGRCDGAQPLGSVLRAVAKEAGVAQDVLAREALPILRHLVERGFLDPPELGKDGAPPRV